MLQNEHAVIVIRNPHLSNVVLHESPEENQKLNSIAEILAPLTTGTPISHDVLTMIPLHREEKSQVRSSIKMLAQAIAEETVEVTEISEDGSVPSIHAKSLDDASILILDGEELIGAKQNRIANLTILIPPHASLNIPVSCVEAGRWSSRSRRFKSSGHMQFTEARAHKAASVSESLRFHKSYRSDQEEVWDDVDSLLDRLNVKSESRSMSDVYELYHMQLEVYERALHIPAEAVGAVFLIRGQLTGLELFGSHEILARAWPKLLCSYAMQALAEGASSNENAIEPKPFEAFLKRLQACQVETHQGVGLGTDLRLDSAEVTGGGLLLDQDVIHLYAFVQPPQKVEQQELY